MIVRFLVLLLLGVTMQAVNSSDFESYSPKELEKFLTSEVNSESCDFQTGRAVERAIIQLKRAKKIDFSTYNKLLGLRISWHEQCVKKGVMSDRPEKESLFPLR